MALSRLAGEGGGEGRGRGQGEGVLLSSRGAKRRGGDRSLVVREAVRRMAEQEGFEK